MKISSSSSSSFHPLAVGISLLQIRSLLLLFKTLNSNVVKAYDQSLEDCREVASHFRNTCGGVDTPPSSSVESMTGETFTCPNKPRCIEGGTLINGSDCTWTRKLCVTCRIDNNGVTLIRIQSNNLPDHCVASSSIKAKNFDYEVPFNPRHNYGDWIQTFDTQAELNRAVCPIRKTRPSATAVEFGDEESAQAMGFAINGVAFQFANQIREDPVYPISVLNEQPLDVCLGHNQRNSDSGMYHYHDISPCLFTTANEAVGSCKDHPDCSRNITEWSIQGYSTVQTKTIIGISKDGHVMYGPYNNDGELWQPSEVDACNGAWSDNGDDYFYVGTRWHPYLAGCQGPANFPHNQQHDAIYAQCSLNGMDKYHDFTDSAADTEEGPSITYANAVVPITEQQSSGEEGQGDGISAVAEPKPTTDEAEEEEEEEEYRIEVLPPAEGFGTTSSSSRRRWKKSFLLLVVVTTNLICTMVAATAAVH